MAKTTNNDPGDMASSEGEASPAPGGFPPYPPYATEPAPPSVADTIIAGRDLRVQHKSTPKKSVRLPPKPAKPRGAKVTDVKMSKRAARAHARCLRRHGAVLTDRLEYISKPLRRTIIYLWREHSHTLPAETIARIRAMLDADEPFKPDQAYEYFINLRKTKNKVAASRGVNQIKKDMLAMCGDKRILWARNATVSFARGIQQRLSRPGCYSLADGMMRLSNIILEDMCGYMHIKMPSRRCTHPKAKFMMEMSDKVAVWIDEILTESDDRMLMMDFDEDDDILGGPNEAGDTGFTDDFLNMMGDGGLLKGPNPAYLKFTGDMAEAFTILTDSMNSKGNEQLLLYGKFKQTYSEAVDELKQATDFEATEFNTTLANQLRNDLAAVAKPNTPNNIAPFMKDVVNICSNYLAQHAEFNKDKGPAFQLLLKAMRARGNEQLYHKGKAKRTYTKAAKELDKAKGLESDHDDPNLSQEIHSHLHKLTESQTPDDLKIDMRETMDICSKYLSQCAVDEIERGPAFNILIKELEKKGADPFTPQFQCLDTKFVAAYVLKSAPGLCSVMPDASNTKIFAQALHKAVDAVTPKNLRREMGDVIERCANYLSAFVRDRDKAVQALIKMLKSNPNNELAKRNNYAMNYGTAAVEMEDAPYIVPFMPVKDIADEAKTKLTKDMQQVTTPDMRIPTKAVIQDASKYLSQPIAMRSGVAGERYPLDFLAAVKTSLGSKPLFKYKAFGQTYSDAAEELKYAGPLEYDPKYEKLENEISAEMNRGVPNRLSPSIAGDLDGTMDDASKHLAKVGTEKGEALQHLVNLMKNEGDTPLGQIQGYQQSYVDGARRLENSNSLTTEKVDKGIYESVREKLTNLTEKKPAPEHSKQMPGIIDDSAKFLASPVPESEAEKRQVLADLIARKGDELLDEGSIYKITYKEAGEEIMNAPVGVVRAHDENKKKELLQKINDVIPEKKLKTTLKEPINEGAAYLSDIIKGRDEVMQVLHDEMKNEKDNEFLNVGKFQKTHEQTAQMLEKVHHFGGQPSSPVLEDKVAEKIHKLSTSGISESAKPYIPDASDITSHYIAAEATKQSALDMKSLSDWSKKEKAKESVSPSSSPQSVPPRKPSLSPPASSAKTAASSSGALKREMEELKRKEQEAERRRRLEAERRRRAALGEDFDPEREQAIEILHKQLRARGGEMFYKQPHTELSHAQASEWLSMKPPMKVDKSAKECGDSARLQKKFERKLSHLVSASTPIDMYDTMQDVVIESSRKLSELFVTQSFKVLVQAAFISEMQKRGNEILIEVDGAAETFLFAAQRLKKATSLEVKELCSQVSYRLTKKLEDIIKCRSMPRKLTTAMKDHIKDAADYLSAHVTKPDEQIEAYVALLNEMEAAGDGLLIEGDIPKSYKEASAYLRQLTSFQDSISLPDSSLLSNIEGKLRNLMSNVNLSGYSKSVMDGVIRESTKLLVSYIKLQGIKTEALKILVEQIDKEGDNVLLRHGTIRKSFSDGADILRSKNADQLNVLSADPVVTRKIQIKLHNLMSSSTPDKYLALMDDVIEDATMYLAIHFLHPHVIQVCKCMKNVFVQCELWCDEILRRVAKPCCTCSRHISSQALADLGPGTSRGYTHGLDLTPCPVDLSKKFPNQGEKPYALTCPAKKPTEECKKAMTSYLMYSSEYKNPYLNPGSVLGEVRFRKHGLMTDSSSSSLIKTPAHNNLQVLGQDTSSTSFGTSKSVSSESQKPTSENAVWQSPTTMFSTINRITSPKQNRSRLSKDLNFSVVPRERRIISKRGYNTRTPIVTTDQMADWHAMMVSLTWNAQAWRGWIQENINRALNYQDKEETEESWNVFQRQISTEALQWRQYNNFSSQLTYRLALRYRDKQIVSPIRASPKTDIYKRCQEEMLDIINIFHRWTQWLTVVIKETSTHQAVTDTPIVKSRWQEFKTKVEEYIEDWNKYNEHLKVCWEQKYKTLIADWLPELSKSGAVWVVSACGAVPSGAVAGGIFEGEVIWVARTTHRCNVLPAALHPSKHCCIVYSDGGVHHYTKYQVMCNAEVSWIACRAGDTRDGIAKDGAGARAVRASRDVFIGRVLYRGSHLVGAVHAPAYHCHVVIFGRPFAFNCYELLILSDER